MKMLKILLIFLAVFVLAILAAAQDFTKLSKLLIQAKGNYVGSEACGVCHQENYDWWFGSGHAHKLRPASEGRGAGIPHPDSVTWDDVKWMIGGFKWKARFVGTDGYIITKDGKNQFNLATRGWVDYDKDEVKPYDCGSCHTTGYNPSGNQEFLPGVVGTWVFMSIHCEECHGPGKDHVLGGGDITKITIDRTSASCGKCHYRTDPNIIPARGGFIRHHEQYNEFLKSSHSETLECVSCHDPHKTGHESIIMTCEDCHSDIAAVYEESHMGEEGVKCEDCHMPAMTKSAVSLRKWVADVKTHLFNINMDADAQPFTSDGSQAIGHITTEFSCLVCHYDRDKAWAASYKGMAHSID